ncbi:hypothetical protein BDM02DRAFT_3092927 [Thelephora ganbajun]|uniref:Uncharacterized protein n=1 Tax=Thelephora ganbajun TaxID=370292 RepID=A0ACB6ZLH5_THEGA|nr:hypothetical protein BDM02DRAFT_3092927 [Thelephora ganbajun]
MDNLPPIPPIEGELMLEVYTHESLNTKPGAITTDEHGGSARLAILGKRVLESAVMTNLFRRRPMYTASQLEEMTADCVSKTSVDQWATAYGLRNKVRCAPGVVTRLKNAEEGRLLFVSYVGALCIQSGYNVVQDWINQLLEPSEKRPTPRISQPPPYMPGTTNAFPNANGLSPQPAGVPFQPQPPPPTTKPPPLPPTPNQQISYLPLFNQTASQRRLGVEYTAQFYGPPHAGKWHVKCLVNNVEKGQGTGPSKQLAKEEAAKQAFYTMGWST